MERAARLIPALVGLGLLAACGADGAPERPAYTIGPDVTIGIDSHGNTDVGATVGVGRGPVTVIVGL
ncbi:hypothetical protein AADZ90_000430 [Aestuariibius sp. 2305UL40-4]|uniref:hypothetical protein n=1 Tax=Aestuariibius violaceus TaxID=3234132 RepID=UPI00345F0ED1